MSNKFSNDWWSSNEKYINWFTDNSNLPLYVRWTRFGQNQNVKKIKLYAVKTFTHWAYVGIYKQYKYYNYIIYIIFENKLK